MFALFDCWLVNDDYEGKEEEEEESTGKKGIIEKRLAAFFIYFFILFFTCVQFLSKFLNGVCWIWTHGEKTDERDGIFTLVKCCLQIKYDGLWELFPHGVCYVFSCLWYSSVRTPTAKQQSTHFVTWGVVNNWQLTQLIHLYGNRYGHYQHFASSKLKGCMKFSPALIHSYYLSSIRQE